MVLDGQKNPQAFKESIFASVPVVSLNLNERINEYSAALYAKNVINPSKDSGGVFTIIKEILKKNSNYSTLKYRANRRLYIKKKPWRHKKKNYNASFKKNK